MTRKKDIPQFGNLSGVRVFANAQSIAGPFVAALMAEQGADVILNEYFMDMVRNTKTMIEQNRLNQRNISLNIFKPEAREVFFKIIKDVDILIESNRGGTYEKKGLSDEVLWEVNPKLIIVHLSGFGQYGDPDWIYRPSWDAVAQAASGYMHFQGFPGNIPTPARPYTGDFVTAFMALYGALAALYNVQKTGRGESIDVAQYEALMRVDASYWSMHATDGRPIQQMGSGDPTTAGIDNYPCKDGLICILFVGFTAFQGGMKALGLDYPSVEWPEPENKICYFVGTEPGTKLDKQLRDFCAARTVEEVDRILSKAGVACSPIMTYDMMKKNPHFQKREVFTEWEAMDGRTITGVNMFPKFKNKPSKMWRAAATQGLDTEDIMLDLGYTKEQIEEMYEKDILRRKE
jgi:L-carnitine CoA-transferase